MYVQLRGVYAVDERSTVSDGIAQPIHDLLDERETISMKTILRSQELSCSSCVAKIEKALTALHGVDMAKVHFNTGRIEVQHDPHAVSTDELVKAVRAVGYESQVSAF
jgi:copper chaperone CopZ